MDRPRRILFVLNSCRYFVMHRLPLANALKKAGYEVGVVAKNDDASAQQMIIDAGLSFFDFPISSRNVNPIEELRSVLFLWRVLRQYKPDLVHSLTIKAVIYSGLLCQAASLKMVSLIPGRGTAFQMPGLGGRFLSKIATLLYRLALRQKSVRVCFQNEDDRNFFIENRIVPLDRTKIIPGSGVDLKEYVFNDYQIEKPTRRVLLISRMLRDKGIEDFARAADIVAAKGLKAEFVMVGAPDLTNPRSFSVGELEQLCRDHAVTYLGHRRDVAQILSQGDIFCLPTYYGEGIPKCILEAQASGVPVITTDVAGCKDVVESGVTGILVPPHSPECLADAIAGLIMDPQQARRLAINAYDRVLTKFQVSIINELYLRLYDEIVSAGSAAMAGCECSPVKIAARSS